MGRGGRDSGYRTLYRTLDTKSGVAIDDYLATDAVGLAALVRAGTTTPDELAALARQRHEATHAAINAVVEWYAEPTPPRPASLAVGPFAGVPTLRKDFGATERGRLVEMGSRLAVGLVASATSPWFQRLADAGAQVLGRTAVPEFAQHATTESVLCGPTRNPLDPTTSAGGSSGGAAAAVRAGVVPMAHASDAAGSIRIPAAVTGLIGLKPTAGLIPAPVDAWRGLVTEFVLARSVADVATALRVLTDRTLDAARDSPADRTPGGAPAGTARDRSTAIGPLRIGLSLDHWAGHPNDPAVTAAVKATAEALAQLGHRVEPVARPFDYEQLMSTWFPLFGGGVADAIARVAASTGRPPNGDNLEPNTLRTLEAVAGLTPQDLTDAAANRAAVTADLAAGFEAYDVLLTPTLDRPVIPLGRMAGDALIDTYLADGDEWFDRLYLANVTGWPAVSLPAASPGTASIGGGAPALGVQFMAPPRREDLLLRVAADLLGSAIIAAVEPPLDVT